MGKAGAVREATGRDRDEWFGELDAWGASGRPYREIAAWLTGEHGLSKWWAQKLIVEYEQKRGLRAPGVRRDGTFEVGTSKTVEVAAKRAFDAFVDDDRRVQWLRDGEMTLRTCRPGRSARFDWGDGSTRVNVDFAEKTPSRATVTVTHGRLRSSEEAECAKTLWKQRLIDLKSFLES